jgi:D-alanyl-D-alanine carboxypeptidase/D-alanyl-D-alanine-endopeptidase (penicillin-binding protein 4)
MIILLIFSIVSLDSIFTQPDVIPAHVGMYVLNLTNDSVVYAYNSQKLLIPASNMKIITSAAALYLLDPQYHYTTRLAVRGEVEGNTLRGDVVIIGGGDPQLSLESLRKFVATLHRIGIRNITGDIILVDDYFVDERLPMGWSRHYFDARYAPEISALSVNHNCVNVKIEATAVGDYAKITIEPQTEYVTLINKMVTRASDDSIIIYRTEADNVIYLDGGIAEGRKRDIEVAVKDPAMFAGTYFKEKIHEANIMFNGDIIKGNNNDMANVVTIIDSVTSPPLLNIIKETNIESDNLSAEILLKTLGVHYYYDGSFLSGLSKVKQFLRLCGVDTNVVSIWDGSGLSRHDLISPYYLALVLRFMYRSHFFEDYYELFPSPGDGTLENRFADFMYPLHAKTGTLHAVSCLSGYIRIEETDYCFSLMFNNFTCQRKIIERMQEEILTALVTILSGKQRSNK